MPDYASSKAPFVRIKAIYLRGRKVKMTRSLLCLLAGLVLGFLLAFAIKAREFKRLSATNHELASQLELEKHQLEAEKHRLELQRQLTDAATATIRLATGQLNECNQALHRSTTRLRSQ